MDIEKTEDYLENDAQGLTHYVVPVLEKGVKTVRKEPPSAFIRFRIWYNPYRMLFTLTFLINMIGILLACLHKFPYAEHHGAAIALGNLVAAVASRNEFFLRYLFWVVVKIFQKWSPLWLRISITAFLQHIGGIHSGCATSGIAWFIFIVVRAFQNHAIQNTPKVILAWGIIATVITVVAAIAAAPWIRHNHHNVFERLHRFAGWTSVIFVWIYVCLSDSLNAEGGFTSNGRRLVLSQEFWFTLFISILVVVPWVTVRKVPVEITTPSPRVAIIKFERGIQQGLLGRISRSAVMEYHGFGIISEGIESGCHYMIAGVQGDWTKALVNDPPTHLYTRQLKFAGLPYLAHLYRRGIAICTGSGIGAVLSTCVQLDNWFLIWIGSDMEKTFGPVLFDMIQRRIPKERYILFDTKKEGRRPDTMKMLKDIYVAFNAEGEHPHRPSYVNELIYICLVVVITSNPKGNAELMEGCKENGMHSFGPLWDS
ncbi:hypothetical protein PHLCEN_2v6822 [Hermanssonia centrifuga]|uniref:Non-ribosomal peptide synthetase n=1 Tax=Hermanssonia centrifuga TaxID=98765 RepID=A0A2R6NY93_9APHY|nr:hypothetical protein PHLCEN_2v6822 [Hermanssonia centrifuga]